LFHHIQKPFTMASTGEAARRKACVQHSPSRLLRWRHREPSIEQLDRSSRGVSSHQPCAARLHFVPYVKFVRNEGRQSAARRLGNRPLGSAMPLLWQGTHVDVHRESEARARSTAGSDQTGIRSDRADYLVGVRQISPDKDSLGYAVNRARSARWAFASNAAPQSSRLRIEPAYACGRLYRLTHGASYAPARTATATPCECCPYCSKGPTAVVKRSN